MQIIKGLILTPSLPQAVEFPGWKMHGHVCKQYIFRSCNNLLSMLCLLMKILSHASAKKKTKRFQILHFYLLFLSDITAAKGLIIHLSHPLPAETCWIFNGNINFSGYSILRWIKLESTCLRTLGSASRATMMGRLKEPVGFCYRFIAPRFRLQKLMLCICQTWSWEGSGGCSSSSSRAKMHSLWLEAM